MSNFEQQAAKIRNQPGFIAALDQSGGSTPKALKLYGVEENTYSGEQQMMDLVHKMRTRIVTSPVFTGQRIAGAILFEATMDRTFGGKPAAEYLWNTKQVLPFLKIDKGLADEVDGVQLMKPNPDLDALLERAVRKGIFGTKERSVIHLANPQGIADVVAQQFEVGKQVLSHGLVPIIEPEVNIKSAERAHSDELLRDEILKHLDRLPEGSEVMLKLSIPANPGTFDALVKHPRVLRVVALSGGFSRTDACRELAKNPGMIASFSRALLESLRHDTSDADFDRELGEAIDEIYEASTEKVAA